MERDMALATIQAQLAQLTAQLTHNAERTTMPSVPTLDVPYGQGYQSPQFSANEDAWGYQGYDQPSNNMFSNAYNSACRDYSNYMWGEPQQFQQEGYWQQEEDFCSKPMQYAQSNSGSSINYNQILNELNSLVQGSQNQDKKLDKFKSQMGEIMEFMVQIQEQSELSSPTVENLKEDFEIHDAITLEGDMKDEAVPEPSKHSPNMDELLLQAEEEEDDLGSLEEFLLQAPQIPMSSNSGEEVLNSLHSNIIPPNVLCPCRFLIPNIKESEKDIVEALPKVQSDIPILGAPKQVPDGIETFKELCTPRKGIQENEVVEAYQEYIQEAVHETIKPKAVEFDDTGQATTIIVNLAKFKVPEMFKNVVFVIEFVSEKESKPSSPILILIYTNMFLILMIQAPTLEFEPLPNHFKYHLPLKDKFHALEPSGV
ncbi:hypothetical protein ACFX1R_039842 [Malus domestica]